LPHTNIDYCLSSLYHELGVLNSLWICRQSENSGKYNAQEVVTDGSWTLHSSTSSAEINKEKECAATFREYCKLMCDAVKAWNSAGNPVHERSSV
jgi:hypothetical protein